MSHVVVGEMCNFQQECTVATLPPCACAGAYSAKLTMLPYQHITYFIFVRAIDLVCIGVCCLVPSQDGSGLQDQKQEWSAYHKKCLGFIERLSVLIIGPGLGDDPQVC